MESIEVPQIFEIELVANCNLVKCISKVDGRSGGNHGIKVTLVSTLKPQKCYMLGKNKYKNVYDHRLFKLITRKSANSHKLYLVVHVGVRS